MPDELPPYAFPPKSSKQDEKVDDDGTRTITYDDTEGRHHTVVIRRNGKARETIKTDADPNKPKPSVPPVQERSFTVSFNEKDGTRTETESSESPDGSTSEDVTVFDKNGRKIRTERQIFDPKKDEQIITTTVYDDDGDRKEVVEEKQYFTTVNEQGDKQMTSGTRKTTEYRDKKPAKVTHAHWNVETSEWVDDRKGSKP